MHLRSYRHPKDGESEDADKMEEENEILDEFRTDEKKLQEAKDHEFAIKLIQEMNDGEDEYDPFCKKPSAAFEVNCTALVSWFFDEQKLPKKSDVVPVEGNVITLMEMSFTRELAIKALEMTDNNIEQAVDWIFDHPGDMHHNAEAANNETGPETEPELLCPNYANCQKAFHTEEELFEHVDIPDPCPGSEDSDG